MSKGSDIAKFLNNQGALIVEPSNAFSSLIQNCLVGFGMDSKQIFVAATFSDAVVLLKREKPKILITEYTLGKQFGLSLVEMHDEMYDALARLCIMVTKEASDNTVAEAAEEQLDAFIVKPFSGADFQKRMKEVIVRKMYPSDYFQKIREGKDQLKLKNVDRAIALFAEAKAMNPRPTLACYFLGECYQAKNELPKARKEFSEGRTFNNLHYKCLTGEFDCLIQEKKYAEAYKLVEIIRTHFPVTSARLGKFFIAAVYTENFPDLAVFYETYSNLEYRPAELVHLVTLALFTSGRAYLRKADPESAARYFEMAISVSGRSMEMIEKIIDELLKVPEIPMAEKMLKLTRADDVGSPKHALLNFKVGSFIMSPDAALEMGRKLIAQGNTTPDVTKKIVQMALDGGKVTLAESLVNSGSKIYPELRQELYAMLERRQK